MLLLRGNKQRQALEAKLTSQASSQVKSTNKLKNELASQITSTKQLRNNLASQTASTSRNAQDLY